MIEKALMVAIRAHEGQKRKSGEPYITHPLAVCEAVKTVEEKTVAILHDVVEDSNITLDDLRKDFPENIVDAVDHVTRRDGEKYKDFIIRAKRNEIARVVKIADIEHNLKTLPEHHTLRKRYNGALYALKNQTIPMENWVLDVTLIDQYGPCFCPIRDDGDVVFGLNVAQAMCPGNLVAAVHMDGQDAAEKWVRDNPDWHEIYGPESENR
jgi:hypothetical protein